MSLNWEIWAWQPDPPADAFPELVEAHGERKAPELMIRPVKVPLSWVQTDFVDEDETLREWHRRQRA